MTITLKIVFLIVALICFALATFGVKGPPGGWQPVGLFFIGLFLW
jgi:nicotinamide mononucleotide (NMN) deamidase PncC